MQSNTTNIEVGSRVKLIDAHDRKLIGATAVVLSLSIPYPSESAIVWLEFNASYICQDRIVTIPTNGLQKLKNGENTPEMKNDDTSFTQMFKKMDVNTPITKSQREVDLERRIQETYRLLLECVENSGCTSEEDTYTRAIEILCEQCQLRPLNTVTFKA